MNAVIRAAGQADAAQACNLLCRSISECCAEDHRNDSAILAAWLGNKTPENVASWFACASHHSLVACDGSDVTGVAIMTRQGRIVLFYIAPEVRSTGTAKALLGALETQAREWGLRALQVASTLTARGFYERNGFDYCGPARTAFGTDAVALAKKLPGSGCGCGRRS
ncbi:GNAT family N-acetyltransferase [Noviherbaspirillum sp.]|uniref:GNAT family N-acetyltransferase n=1 Tax=Noviherbaspirillum sp. TaxID=1926288 RepID=UPI002D6E1995|nr:GNAT family N-acetyltransferase [Noviherbaspirillum sp.]HZW20405.1 GNAT family N-acetyltransferase [Noviherbaspirillum sp.]